MCHNLSFSTSRRYHTIVFIYPFFYSHVIGTHCTAKELDWRITTIGFANSNHFKIIATKLCSVCYCGADFISRLPISTSGPLWYQVINMFETSFTEPIYKKGEPDLCCSKIEKILLQQNFCCRCDAVWPCEQKGNFPKKVENFLFQAAWTRWNTWPYKIDGRIINGCHYFTININKELASLRKGER